MKKHLSLFLLLFALIFAERAKGQGTGATITTTESRCIATGTMTISGAAGTGPFTYSFSSYPVDYAYSGPTTNTTITALNPGTYDVVINDLGTGTSTTYPGVIVDGSYVEPSYNIMPTDVTGCYFGNNGSISGVLADGRAPFYYEIMSGPSNVGATNTSGTFTGLSAGTYVLRGYDSCGNFQTRTTTVGGFYWGIGSNAATKTACGQYTLDLVNLNTIVPGATYTVKQGGTIIGGPSSSFPISFSNPDNTITSVQVCVTDPCGFEQCQPLGTIADWSITFSNATYPSCNTFSLNTVTISGTPIGPVTYGFVRAVGDTVWSSTLPFTFPPANPLNNGLTYFWGQAVAKDGCGVVKVTPNYYDRYMDVYLGYSSYFSSCTEGQIVSNAAWNYVDPVTYTINGGAPQSSGTFNNLTDGYYNVVMTDACGNTASQGVSIDHNWETSGGYEPNCALGLYRNYVYVNRRMKTPVTYEQWDATYSTLVSTQQYTDPYQMNNAGAGYSDVYQAVSFYNAVANTTYNYIVTDDCGRKDTVTIVNGLTGHVPNTLSLTMTPYCTGKGDITASFVSDNPTWNPVIVELRNIDGTLAQSYNNTYNASGVFNWYNQNPGTYKVNIWNQYCSDTISATIVVPAYKLPKLRKSIAFNCSGNNISVVGAGKFGLKPYTYEIWQTSPAGGEQAPQASNIFSLTGNYTLVRMRLVDVCGNSSLQDMAVRPPSPVAIATVVKTPNCNMTSMTLYVDSSLTGATFEWKNPAGSVIGTNPSLVLNPISTADTGLYTCRVQIAGTCYDVTSSFRLRAKDFGCFAQLGNYVWLDENHDGIQDATEVGVSGVTVVLYDNAGNVVSSTVTDAYGKYLFTQLNPGTYHVGFSLPSNYVFSSADQTGDASDSDPNTATGMTGNYTLVAGDSNMTVDAGIYLPSSPTASLGDYVWNDLNANGVQDPGELGISGVTVTLYDGSGNPIGTTVTDASGHYYFTDLNPGTYSVGFSQPIGYVFSPQDQGGDGTDSDVNPSSGKSGNYTLVAGENNLTIDAGLHSQDPLKAALGNYVWFDANQNGQQDANEAGVAGVSVTLYAADGTTVLGTTTTDEFGYYIFNDLNAGDYVVGFSNYPSGFVQTTQNSGNDATDSDPDASGKTGIINLSAGEKDMTIDAGIYNPSGPIGALGNRVWYDRNKNGIQDAGENGVPGVTVTLYAADGTTVLAVTATDANGFYLFPNLPAATYVVGFSNTPPNYSFTTPLQGGNTATDSNPNGTGKTAPIVLGSGEVNLTIDAGIIEGSVRNNKASLGDLVWYDANNNGIQDAGELGVPGVTVTLYAADGITVLGTKITDALGNYIFTGLDAGSYQIGFSNIPAGYTFSAANQGSDDEIDADADASTSGRTGFYSLLDGEENLTIDAGIYANPLLASLGNFVWNDLNQDGIQDANEPGVPGVTVTLYNTAGVALGTTTTDANGAYQFVGLTPGTYYVEFTNLPAGFEFTIQDAGANGFDATDSDADPNNGSTTWVTLVAGQNYPDFDAGIFTEQAGLGDFVWNDYNNNGIQDAGEPGIPGITVTLYAANGITPLASAITDANGHYSFVNLDPGTYVVGFSGIPTGSTFSSPLQGGNTGLDSDPDVTTGKTGQITLNAGDYNPTIDAGIHTPSGAGLGNYVWLDANYDGLQDANESGVPGVTVTLYDVNGVAIQSAITDQNGFYSFPNLTPGTYSVGFTTLPTQVAWTTSNVNSNGNDATDSDIDPASVVLNGEFPVSGKILPVTIVAGEYNPTLDAGLVVKFPLDLGKLEAFATLTGSEATVHWITENEKNIKNFDIQRSIDGVNFQSVGNAEAKGNTNGVTNYSIKNNVANLLDLSVIYYRVISSDQNGQKKVSNTATVRPGQQVDPIQIYPTPFTTTFTIDYPSTTESGVTIAVTDVAGNVLLTKDVSIVKGSNSIVIDNLGSLAKGNYFVKITDNTSGEKFIKKLLKK